MTNYIKTVNGNDVSWGSMRFKIGGELIYGYSSVTWGHKLELVKGYGAGPDHAPTRRSRGKYTVEPLKVKFFKETAQRMRRALAALSSNGKVYSEPEFPATLQYVEKSSSASHIVEFQRLRYIEEANSHDESAELLVEEITFDPMLIIVDGLTLANADS